MKAIILAAGYATRLYPITRSLPKPLLDIAGKPLIDHIMEKIEEIPQIDEVIVVSNDKFYQHFSLWADEYPSKKKVTLINDGTRTNETRLGAIKDMYLAVKRAKVDDDILVIAGDNLFKFSLPAFIAAFSEKNTPMLAVCDLRDKAKLAKRFGTVEVDADSRIVGFEEKPEEPKTTLAATACYIYTKEDVRELVRLVESGSSVPDAPGEFIKHLLSKKSVHAFRFSEPWYDIGNHDHLDIVRARYRGARP